MPEAGSEKESTLAGLLLEHARSTRTPLSVYLVSGFQLKGEIVDFDDESVLVSHKKVHQVVMRTGIATMYPIGGAGHDGKEWWGAGSGVKGEGGAVSPSLR